jgi:hypothetical protein
MTTINLYLENHKKLLKTFQVDESDIKNIDRARRLLITKLDPFYFNSKYKVIVRDRFNYSEIDVIFEKNTELNREFLLKEILPK